MKVVKANQKNKASETAAGDQPTQQTEKPKPIYYAISEEALTNVLTALTELPWKQSNPIITYLRSNVKPVNLTETPKDQQDEKDNKTTSDQ